jgi:hypothetical protein
VNLVPDNSKKLKKPTQKNAGLWICVHHHQVNEESVEFNEGYNQMLLDFQPIPTNKRHQHKKWGLWRTVSHQANGESVELCMKRSQMTHYC